MILSSDGTLRFLSSILPQRSIFTHTVLCDLCQFFLSNDIANYAEENTFQVVNKNLDNVPNYFK